VLNYPYLNIKNRVRELLNKKIFKVSDALKLIIKETVIPAQANKVLFYLAPVLAIIVSLLG
jgi:hypothetical protein